mmetsp:Transcript_31512/g.40516  ORF Transcript_31512/g.40516 Transcript_31512/m.40516 type:complete len:284 (+) Transcript_31512:114-965(+)
MDKKSGDSIEISWPDISRVELLRQQPFAKPEAKKRQRPKTWKDEWESLIIDSSPYAKHVAPVKAKHIPTAGEIAEKRLKKLKDKLDIKESDLPSANQMDVEADFDLQGWKHEMEAMQLLLGPTAELAAQYPMTQLREEIHGQPGMTQEMKEELASYKLPRYQHVEFEDTPSSWEKLGPAVPSRSASSKEVTRPSGKDAKANHGNRKGAPPPSLRVVPSSAALPHTTKKQGAHSVDAAVTEVPGKSGSNPAFATPKKDFRRLLQLIIPHFLLGGKVSIIYHFHY